MKDDPKCSACGADMAPGVARQRWILDGMGRWLERAVCSSGCADRFGGATTPDDRAFEDELARRRAS